MKKFVTPLFIGVLLIPTAACGWRTSAQLRSIDRERLAIEERLSRKPAPTDPSSDRKQIEKDLIGLVIRLDRLLQSGSQLAEVEWRLGECYRLGHLLDLPEAWTQAERHLKIALGIDSAHAQARCSLGQLYLQTGVDFAPKAEQEFRRALELARETPLPEAHKGLFYSYGYQARFAEALMEAEKYAQLRPDDKDFEKAMALAKTNLEIRNRQKS